MAETPEERRHRQRLRYRTNPKRRYNKYVDNARRKSIPFQLTFDDAFAMFTRACVYCGYFSEDHLNGIDRVDSSGVYCIENCVACCNVCNMMKGVLKNTIFIEQCVQVARWAGKHA